jgi:hypothetical protein
MSVRRIGARAALVAAGVLASVALMAAPSWAIKEGNSSQSHLCAKGGWATAAPAGGPFASQDACVSYTANMLE